MVNKNNMKRIFLFFMIFVNVLYFSQKRFNGYFVNSSIGTLQKEYSNIKISTNNLYIFHKFACVFLCTFQFQK